VRRTRAAIFYSLIALAVLAAGQWGRAQWVHEWFRWLSPRGERLQGDDRRPAYARAIEFNGSGVAYRFFDCQIKPSDPMGFSYQHAAPEAVPWSESTLSWRTLWFSRGENAEGTRQIAIPYWAICMLGVAAMGVRWVLRHRRARRVLAHVCTVCGYDLRATPKRCPECGTLAPNPAPTLAQP
jgi:hypothetical protein